MSYFVLAIGGLLVLGGAWALFTSYGIILVERGWAGVIAGTTALASGVVTIALGLILHWLSSFHELLKSRSDERASPRGLAEEETVAPRSAQAPQFIPAPETASNSAGVPPAPGLRSWPQRQARAIHSPGRSFFKARGAGAAARPRTRESPPSPSDANEGTADLPFEPGLGSARPAEAAGGGGIGQDLLPHSARADETDAEGRRNGRRGGPGPLQDDAGSEPLTARPLPEMPIAAGVVDVQPWTGRDWPTEPAMTETTFLEAGQIIQQPVAEAEKEGAEKPLSEVQQAASPEPPPVALEAETGALPAEPGPSSEPPISGDTLAIVGRYESEGASFVRYADGSIEARTDHAVFHFKSMAELKRFMDSQAQTPQAQTPKE
jgi:hypothetical protein